MNENALQVQGIEKTYKTFTKDSGFKGAVKSFLNRKIVPVSAVKSSSFNIKKGEFVGLLGPNGAGKTTLLKMMTGLIPPTKGQCIAFDNFDTSKRPKDYLRRIGMVMGQRNQLHPDLPALDSFRLSQAIYAIPQLKFERRLEECLSLFEIHSKLNVPVRKLSLGERMKMELILAILHEPELLFLDEPTIGLDFGAASQIRSFLADANAKFGITTILTSHYSKDIEELCRRVILINFGSIIYDGPLSGLDERIQGEREFKVRLKTLESTKHLVNCLANFEEIASSPVIDELEQTVNFSVTTRLVSKITKSIFDIFPNEYILDMTISERSLEDVFTEVYQRATDNRLKEQR